MTKKYLLSFGLVTTAIAPVATVVSCTKEVVKEVQTSASALEAITNKLTVSAPATANKTMNDLNKYLNGTLVFDENITEQIGVTTNYSTIADEIPSDVIFTYKLVRNAHTGINNAQTYVLKVTGKTGKGLTKSKADVTLTSSDRHSTGITDQEKVDYDKTTIETYMGTKTDVLRATLENEKSAAFQNFTTSKATTLGFGALPATEYSSTLQYKLERLAYADNTKWTYTLTIKVSNGTAETTFTKVLTASDIYVAPPAPTGQTTMGTVLKIINQVSAMEPVLISSLTSKVAESDLDVEIPHSQINSKIGVDFGSINTYGLTLSWIIQKTDYDGSTEAHDDYQSYWVELVARKANGDKIETGEGIEFAVYFAKNDHLAILQQYNILGKTKYQSTKNWAAIQADTSNSEGINSITEYNTLLGTSITLNNGITVSNDGFDIEDDNSFWTGHIKTGGYFSLLHSFDLSKNGITISGISDTWYSDVSGVVSSDFIKNSETERIDRLAVLLAEEGYFTKDLNSSLQLGTTLDVPANTLLEQNQISALLPDGFQKWENDNGEIVGENYFSTEFITEGFWSNVELQYRNKTAVSSNSTSCEIELLISNGTYSKLLHTFTPTKNATRANNGINSVAATVKDSLSMTSNTKTITSGLTEDQLPESFGEEASWDDDGENAELYIPYDIFNFGFFPYQYLEFSKTHSNTHTFEDVLHTKIWFAWNLATKTLTIEISRPNGTTVTLTLTVLPYTLNIQNGIDTAAKLFREGFGIASNGTTTTIDVNNSPSNLPSDKTETELNIEYYYNGDFHIRVVEDDYNKSIYFENSNPTTSLGGAAEYKNMMAIFETSTYTWTLATKTLAITLKHPDGGTPITFTFTINPTGV